ncbi:CCA tRNA nucleotidyltransferase [Halomarina pelagica]|uniref:CCA tRNA nucleotidyltransferase n=1 Tax=Halomarina pelagica TaxID=2961599 RepID=UPI0020C33AFE|nr:CCA tRNA nucleotidyltransferase [Halomarina sp. BND7]
MDEFEAVTEEVAARVVPDDAERGRLARTAARVVADAEAAAADLPVEADVVQVGSTARGTWVSGDRDIDVFVRFPPELPRRELERYGLAVGRAVLPDGHEEYAEHPYVKGTREGFEVDLVPCYAVEDATAIQSAVDRTPFHTAYLTERLDDDSAREVVLTKAFLKGVGVYGSDLRTRGFSGYLTELLVLGYGGFRAFLEAARDWHPPVELDPEGHAARGFDDPLVVVDPTDPERNVAAVLSVGNVARLVHHARAFLDEPRAEAFEPRDPEPLDADAMAAHLERRGTTPFAVRFPAPDLVDDQLYPQLEKSLSGVVGELDRRGFDVLRAATFADETAVLFVECEVAERPRIARHEGPPVWVGRHATGFYDKYADGDAYGPFVDGERYVVERERGRATAREWLESDDLLGVSLGVAVEEALRDGYEVLEGRETTALAAEFGVELARYFDPRP